MNGTKTLGGGDFCRIQCCLVSFMREVDIARIVLYLIYKYKSISMYIGGQ